MYFCNSEINEYLENRSEDIAAFLTSGWGKVRINDLLILFDVPAAFFRNIMIHLAGLYHFMQEDDYVYISAYEGGPVASKYMNAISVLTSIAAKNKGDTITLTDSVYSSLFVAKMFVGDKVSNNVQTYYVIDTAMIAVPLYALGDLIKNELSGNGFDPENRLIIIVYDDSEVAYIKLKCRVYYALQIKDTAGCRFIFYNNDLYKQDE